ncbi:hemagglutinin repeat-containing protein [Pseudomonas asplenii]|uniref:two-partner secretion domain-containing protein n=1 Tax=Pseudomonas asplenii TaxID=53407 RepID=UPI0037CA6C8F
MDVRQFAFLVRQPSAALKKRDHFLGLPKRGLAFLLANVMFWQPLWAQADGIVVSAPGTTLGQAGNGVPIVNIAAPNGAGLSHNQFHDYNVGSQGVILNNATDRTQSTQLGGIILGNSNLNGRAASTILNEVNGGSPSQLRGYTEVAGQSAHVIVANPYGITCNGCGFINTPQATLTTGKAVLTNGQVSGYQVDGGSVSIEGAGLNANNIDRFEIITRSAKLNAEIQAKNLAIIAGANDVDAKTLKATARAADPATAPQLAIDSSALGGMYAGAIKLVGTEAGVGVKLDGKMVASGGDIQLDANGHLSMVDTAATGAVTVKAQSLEAKGPVYAGTTLDVTTQGDLTSQNNLVAKDRITLSSGGQLTNNGIIEAGVNADNSRNATGDVSLSAQNVNNAGKGVIASRDLKITATQVLNNNTGAISGAATTKLVAASLNNLQGQVTGNLGLSIDLSGALDNQGGILGSGGALTLNAASLDNRAAGTVLASGGSLTATIRDAVDNRDQGKLRATGAIELAAGSLDNRGGSLAGKDQLTLRSASADNRGGLIQADQDVQLRVDQLDNRDKGNLLGKAALRYEGTRLDNTGGLFSATGPVTLKAEEVANAQGRIASQGDVTANIDTLNQQGGALVAQGALLLIGKSLDNRNGGTVASIQDLTLDVDQIDNRAGELSSTSSKVKLSAQRLDNSDGGKLLAETDLALTVAQLVNQTKGRVFAKGSASLVGTSLDNTGGTFSSLNAVDIRLDGALLNNTGLLSSEGALSLKTGSLDNSRGQLGSAGDLSIDSLGALLNQGGSILTDHGLSLTSSRLDNSQKGRISGLGATRVTTGAFDNSQDGGLTSDDRLDLTATQVNNASGRIASGKDLTANVTGLDQQGGELFSKTNLSLDLNNGQLNNQGGLINGPVLVLNNLKGVNNQGGEISSAQAFTLAAQSLDNSSGKLLSNQGLTLRIEQALSNVKGLISAAALDSRSASLDNSQGQISSRGLLDVGTRDALINQNGTLIADGAILLAADSLDNSQGAISGKGDITATVASLNNQNGQLITQANLGLTGGSLDNRQNGLVGATKALKLNVDQVDNRAGELSSNADIHITASRLDNRDGGKVLAETSLTLNSAQVLNGNLGLLKGKTGLSLDGQTLDNTHGLLISGQDSRLTLTGDLDNSQGLISSEGQLDVSAAKLSNTAGSLSSAGTLTANASAALVNQGGRLVSDSGITVNSASLDNSAQGVISGKGAVGVTTGAFDNSAGSLTSADSLTLTAGQVSNQGGRIGSDKALTASVTGLDQQGGKLFSNSALTLDMNHGQLNNQNGLINAPSLILNNLKGVNNQGGEISSAQAFTLAADSLDNSNGKLLSNQAVTLRVNQALTNLKGLIAAAALDIRADSLDSSNGGEVSAQGDIDLSLGSLTQNGGRLLSDQAIRLDLAGGDLDNRNGLLNAKGPLTLTNLRDLNNQNGELSSSQSFNVVGRNLDNSNGKLISNNRLGVTGNSLINQGGLISGWQGLSVTGSSLDNRNSGTLSSRSGNLDVTLSGALLNGNMGALVSQQTLTVNADSLDNSAGILSSGAEQKLTVAGLLSNIQGGSIDSGAGLTLQAMALNNAGSISAQQAIGFTGTRLDNSAGTLTGNGAVTLDLLGALINNSGKLASAGPLVISRSSQISNQGGQLVSQGLLSLLTGSLDNSNRGTVAANGNLQITSTGAVQNNADGLIYSQTGDLTVNAASLANGKGSLQGQGALSLTVAGDIDNQSGKLIAQNGNLTASAANLDNRGGTLSSLKGGLETRIIGVLKNGYDLNNNRQGGIIQGQRLNLSALGGIDNYGGRISAQSGDTLITTADFDNRNGGVYAKGLVQVTGNNFDNSGDNDGQIAGQRIDLSLNGALNNRLGIIESDSTLSVRAASLDNQTGQLRALGTSGKTDFQIGGLFDNRNGKLETANSDLTLNVGGFQNQGGSLQHVGDGTFDIATANLLNAGGNVTTRGGLTLTADNWTNSSVIEAGRLTVNVGTLNQTAGGQLLAVTNLTGSGGNWNNDGLIASDGTASLNLTGSYGGNGRYSTQGTLGLNAASLSLGSAGSIAGGGDTTLNVGGLLSNSGRLTSNAGLSVVSGSLTNNGTLASAQNLSIKTHDLLNNNGSLLFSGGDMGLQVDTLTNNQGDIYSLGALTVSGYADGTRANQLENISGSLESQDDMTLRAQSLLNRKDKLTYKSSFVSGSIGVNNYYTGSKHRQTNYIATEVFQSSIDEDSRQASLQSGRNLTIDGADVVNRYSAITAAGNINIGADNLSNEGAVAGRTTRTRTWYSGWVKKGSDYAFISNYVVPYNAQTTPTPVSVDAFTNYTSAWGGGLIGDTTTAASGGTGLAAAVIQAGGSVAINATKNLINSSVVEYTHPDVTQQRSTATATAKVLPSVVLLNAQLPPNLAQQQVNPVTLPGFSLPSGQNGLFRLSGQGVASVQAVAPQAQAMGSAAVNPAQHQQSAGDAQARNLQLADAARGSASNLQLEESVRPTTASNVTGSVINVVTPGDAASVQLPAGGQAIKRVQGLPDTSGKSSPQKYLIETNPVLTDLKQFMGSDYLLSNLGYDPDASAKRLGDGLYEQKLIQQAVTARTGQRFIDGQTSDEGLYKYLMDNAIKSKQELNLAVGVSLTSEQVAALTHDIVWLENTEVNGEQVLVPVLYLANANNRLTADGALIQGTDVKLIAGQDLSNAGTLRASNNLSASAGNDLTNSGLIQADNRLDLLAGHNIVNKAGGVIAGRDVSLTATTGDVINERTVTQIDSGNGYATLHRDVADSAARIEAANDLSVRAGRDVTSQGGVLQSGRDTQIVAGRDINLIAAEQRDAVGIGKGHSTEQLTQLSSTLTAGRDVSLAAGRDLTAIASQIDAKRDVAMTATGDLTLASAANEQHVYDQTRKVTRQEDHTQQVATSVSAGGNAVLTAGKDLGLIASKVSAGDEAYLSAAANLTLQTATNDDYSFFSKVKKSSSGKKSQLDEVASSTNMASSVSSGKNTTLMAGQDLIVKGSEVAADKGAAKLVAGNDVQIIAVTDSHSARHESSKSKSSWGGLKSSKVQDKVAETQTAAVGSVISGNTVDVAGLRDVKVTGSGLVSTQDLTVQAGRDLVIDAAENTFSRTEMHKEKNRDLTGVLTANKLGIDDITGNQHLSISSQSHNGQSSQTTLTGSTVGSSQGNVTLAAGRNLAVVASDLVSTKNMSLTGSNVSIAAGMESASQSSTDKSASLAVGRVMGGAVVDGVNTIRSAVKSANNADDPKLKAVKLAQAALAGYNLGVMGASLSDGVDAYLNKQGSTSANGTLIKIGTEIANTHSKSTSEYESQTAKQSSLNVGQTLAIEATGKSAGTVGDIHVIGSTLKAANTDLAAKHDIVLESAQNTADWANNSSNNKTAIGASFNIGQQTGFTLDLGAQIAKSLGTGSSVAQVNSTLDTGALTLHSGNDTTLAGAQVRAKSIDALVEGNLNIASRQDSEAEKNKQGTAGIGGSICIPPFCYGVPVVVSANFSAGNMKSNYKAVDDQSGLFAGAGGYDIYVGHNTTLQGAVIASDATADKNLLSTDRLIASDIKNKSDIKSTSVSVSGSTSFGGGAVSAGLGGMFGMSLSDSDSSKTRSAVSEGTIVVRNADGANDLVGLSRDTANANEKIDRPDKKAMEERMELIRSSVELVNGISDAIATAKMKAAQDPNSEEFKAARQQLLDKGNANPTGDQIAQQVSQNYGVGSSFKKAAQAVSAVVQGVLGGNIGGALAGAAAPYVAQSIKEATKEDDAANLMAHAVWGAVLASSQGNSALAGAAGAGIGEYIAKQLYPNKSVDQLTESEKQTVSALSTLAGGLAGGLAAGGLENAIAAAGAAKNAVENNHLSMEEGLSLDEKRRKYTSSCLGSSSTECQELAADIQALLKKGGSELKHEVISEATDTTWASSQDHKPGDIVMCKISSTGFCIVTDQSLKTAQGDEWYLKPATVEQSLAGRADQAKTQSELQANLKQIAADSFAEGCGGMGAIGIACQLSMAAGVSNPVTGAEATTGERIGWFAQALLNIVGLKAAIGGGAAKSTDANWDNAVSRADGDFGYLNQPEPSKLPAFFDAKNSAVGFIDSGRIKISDLEKLVPPGYADTFKPSASISDGSKFNYVLGGQKVEIKWHSPDAKAAQSFPGSNSGSGWTAQIKIGGKLLGQDGNFYKKPSNLTHIPVDF